MTSRWGWPITEIFHFTGLCLLFGAVGLFDLRMLGVARGVSLRALHRLIPFGLAGFALSITTGFLFVVTTPDQYVYNPALQTKLALMALAGINMVLFYATTARAVKETGADGVPPLRARVFARDITGKLAGGDDLRTGDHRVSPTLVLVLLVLNAPSEGGLAPL